MTEKKNIITTSIANPVNETGGNNEMAVRKYKDKWEVAIPDGRYANGRIKYKRELADTEEEAYRRENELLSEIKELRQELRNAATKEQNTKLFKDAAERWLLTKKRDVAPLTWERYEGILDLHVLPVFGRKQMSLIAKDKIQDYFITHENCGTTLQQHHTIMRGIFKLENINVMDNIPRPRKNEPEINCIKDPAELAKFVASFKGRSILFMPVYIAAVTGMRLSEIAGLRWGDVNLDKGYIMVRRSLHWRKDKKTGIKEWYTKPPKNKMSRRTIMISEHDIKVLTEHKAKNNANNNDFVCLNTKGNPIARFNVSGNFITRARTRGHDISFHSLRHSHATILIQYYRKSIKAVSRRLGHANIATTLSIYTDILPLEDEDIAVTLGEDFACV